jgi:Rieske 2Fe-2S family protein
MNHELRLISRLRNFEPTTPLPREFYISEDDYGVELEAIWYRDWLFVGHDCEVRQPGDYLTAQIGDHQIIVLRDRDGQIRAFHNSCRHRGSRICTQTRGHVSRLVCPYHQWSYRLDGSLIAARDMGEDFDRGQHGLRTVHCESLAGYIWVCLGEVAPDFEQFRAQAEPYLWPHNMQEAKVAFESTIVERANWKLVWENNRECYHCPGNHAALSRTFPADPSVAIQKDPLANEEAMSEWARWESEGLPSRFSIAPGGQSRFVRMSLLGQAVSYTMDGKEAVQRPLSNTVALSNPGVLLMFHYPSTWNHVMRDHAISFRMLPLSPTETQLTTKWLVHKDAQEGVDYDMKRLTEVWLSTNDEDRRVCQENMLGVRSPAYAPARYSPVHEPGVMQFISWYRDSLIQRLAEVYEIKLAV